MTRAIGWDGWSQETTMVIRGALISKAPALALVWWEGRSFSDLEPLDPRPKHCQANDDSSKPSKGPHAARALTCPFPQKPAAQLAAFIQQTKGASATGEKVHLFSHQYPQDLHTLLSTPPSPSLS